MVTNTLKDYDQHKKDVYNRVLSETKSQKYSKNFIKFYSNRYDKWNRSFIDFRLATVLYDDYLEVKYNSGMCWYGIFGPGGQGKSTLAQNIAYFLDPTYNNNRIITDSSEIIDNFLDYVDKPLTSLVFDEPDIDLNANSKRGIYMRSVIGQSRQQQAFPIFCATDVSDVPPFIYKKLNRIIFTPVKRKALLFRDWPEDGIYCLGKLRDDYQKMKSYNAFYMHQDSALDIGTRAGVPFQHNEKNQYLNAKKTNYIETLKEAKKIFNSTLTKKNGKTEKEEIILKMKEQGLTDEKISSYLGLSRSRITQIRGGLM